LALDFVNLRSPFLPQHSLQHQRTDKSGLKMIKAKVRDENTLNQSLLSPARVSFQKSSISLSFASSPFPWQKKLK